VIRGAHLLKDKNPVRVENTQSTAEAAQ